MIVGFKENKLIWIAKLLFGHMFSGDFWADWVDIFYGNLVYFHLSIDKS